MVRLEDHHWKPLFNRPFHFNSKMVRLEGESGRKIEPVKYYFNSKMVRLEEGIFENIESELQFQFQNGTIRRLPIACNCVCVPVFQFQNGTIRRTKAWQKKIITKKISIPKWYD